MEAREIILKPVISEKTTNGMPAKKYTFKVALKSNKIQISKAVEEIFNVQVSKVNTSHVRGRLKRQGKSSGYTPSWKKATVTLTQSSKGIEFFEGMN